MTVRPDGKRVYISNGKDATVSVIDTSNDEIIATIPVGKRPWNMAITPGRQKAVRRGWPLQRSVGHRHRNQPEDHRHPVGERPWGVVIH